MLQRLVAWWHQRQAQRFAQLIEHNRKVFLQQLLDPSNGSEAREEAAWELQFYGNAEVEQALLSIALDPTTDPEVAEQCGYTLGPYWSTKSSLDVAILEQLHPVALQALAGWLEGINREWDLLFSDVLHQRSLHRL